MNNSISAVCFLYGHWNVSWGPEGLSLAHSLAPGCHRGRDMDRDMSWHLQLPFSTSALLFTDVTRMGTSPRPGKTCTKWGKCIDRGKSFLITGAGGFPGDSLLSNTVW